MSDGWAMFWLIMFFIVGIPVLSTVMSPDDRPGGPTPPPARLDSCWDGSGAC